MERSGSQPRRVRLFSWRFGRTAGPVLRMSERQRQYATQVNDALAQGRYRLEQGACICGASAGDIVCQVDRYGIPLDTVLCAACGTMRFEPYLSPGSLAEFYRDCFQDLYARGSDPRAYFWQAGYGNRLLPFVRRVLAPGACVAEAGCGAGGALAVLSDAGFETCGCDYSREHIEFGAAQGLSHLALGDIETLAQDLDSRGTKADLIVLHHVFEHLAAPLDFLVRACSVLAPGGMILVAVPDIEHAQSIAKAGDIRCWLHIAHKYNFSAAGLTVLAGLAGLHASSATVQRNEAEPEMWAAFTREKIAEGLAGHAHADGAAMYHQLRKGELRYLAGAPRRKLAKVAEGWSRALRGRS